MLLPSPLFFSLSLATQELKVLPIFFFVPAERNTCEFDTVIGLPEWPVESHSPGQKWMLGPEQVAPSQSLREALH